MFKFYLKKYMLNNKSMYIDDFGCSAGGWGIKIKNINNEYIFQRDNKKAIKFKSFIKAVEYVITIYAPAFNISTLQLAFKNELGRLDEYTNNVQINISKDIRRNSVLSFEKIDLYATKKQKNILISYLKWLIQNDIPIEDSNNYANDEYGEKREMKSLKARYFLH